MFIIAFHMHASFYLPLFVTAGIFRVQNVGLQQQPSGPPQMFEGPIRYGTFVGTGRLFINLSRVLRLVKNMKLRFIREQIPFRPPFAGVDDLGMTSLKAMKENWSGYWQHADLVWKTKSNCYLWSREKAANLPHYSKLQIFFTDIPHLGKLIYMVILEKCIFFCINTGIYVTLSGSHYHRDT